MCLNLQDDGMTKHTYTHTIYAQHAQGCVNFAIMASSASGVSLVLFDEDDLAAGRSTHEVHVLSLLNVG